MNNNETIDLAVSDDINFGISVHGFIRAQKLAGVLTESNYTDQTVVECLEKLFIALHSSITDNMKNRLRNLINQAAQLAFNGRYD